MAWYGLVTIFCALAIFGNWPCEAASRKPGVGPGDQDWGYVTVRPGAHMFWWLYHTTAKVASPTERPLVIWLQGGPGASSTGYGNFEELGPVDVNLNERNHTWVKHVNVLFIDNPVGSGFSYVDSYSQFTKNNSQIGRDLVQMMHGFYQDQPRYKPVPLYIVAESYGGKMAAEFVYQLYNEIKAGKIDCNLKGVAMGDSWVSPMDSVWTWAPYLFNNGVLDTEGYTEVMKAAQMTQDSFDKGNYVQATNNWAWTENVIMKYSYNVDFYNILKKIHSNGRRMLADAFRKSPIAGLYEIMVNRGHTKADPLDVLMNTVVHETLKIPKSVRWGGQSGDTFSVLQEDFMKPCIDTVELLLNKTDVQVVVFTGQLDLIVDTPGTVKWVEKLRWPEQPSWSRAERKALVEKSVVEGYYKKHGRFSMYWVDRSGHMVPNDNPTAMERILRDLTKFG